VTHHAEGKAMLMKTGNNSFPGFKPGSKKSTPRRSAAPLSSEVSSEEERPREGEITRTSSSCQGLG